MTRIDWVYLEYKNKKLYNEDGTLYCNEEFTSETDANEYLVINNPGASHK